jgi:hypothetical protein
MLDALGVRDETHISLEAAAGHERVRADIVVGSLVGASGQPGSGRGGLSAGCGRIMTGR